MARFVIYEGALEGVDTGEVMRDLADSIAAEARRLAPRDDGQLRESIRVTEVDDDHAVITADPRNPKSSPGKQAYAAHVELGTSDTKRRPFLKPAAYKYRSP